MIMHPNTSEEGQNEKEIDGIRFVNIFLMETKSPEMKIGRRKTRKGQRSRCVKNYK
jgi:hypothetical protein